MATKTKITIENVTEVSEEWVKTSSGKKYASSIQHKVGDQVVCFPNGTSLSPRDLRLSESKEKFNSPKTVKVDKKYNGFVMLATRFIEIQSAIAFTRMAWLKEEAISRPPFEEFLATQDFSDLF